MVEIRDLQEHEIDIVAKFLKLILRLDQTHFAKHLIDSFVYNYAKQFLFESNIKKVAILNDQIVGIALFAKQYNVKYEFDFVKQMQIDLESGLDSNAIHEYQKQVAIIQTINTFVQKLQSNNLIPTDKPELKMLAIDSNFQGQGISKILIQHCLQEMCTNSFWLVTDSNSNWQYYQQNKYILIGQCLVYDEVNQPYLAIDNSNYTIMIYMR